ncbi:cortical protein marker for cell polarity-domain-containing protein [Myxozyma melibiosi]|uniref:Cortical protein marker for cell polarity-domain-containing protein n=1 Tax=Myxozyma melibiosi TaxID=54550 RepID=A0ABR1EYJ4_9ASCO
MRLFALALALSLRAVLALNLKTVDLPAIDLAAFGQVGFSGDFSGLSVYKYASQQSTTTSGTTKLSSSTTTEDSLLLSQSENIFLDLLQTDGVVRSMCLIDSDLYLAGNFTKVGTVRAKAVARVDISSGDVYSLDNGLSGTANAVLCDPEHELVYFGGQFTNNVAIWDTSLEQWADIPFTSLNGGPVHAIVARDNNIVFGGKFTGLGNSSTDSTSSSEDSDSALQVVNMRSSTVTVQGNSNGTYDLPRSVICAQNSTAAESTWLAADESEAVWTADFAYEFNPTKLRLRNADVDDRGTKLFRFVAEPLNGILNLTYTDPETGETEYCDAWCPLPNITTAEYTEFDFVDVIGITGFSLYLLDYYGEGAGLSQVELFQERIMTYAVDDYNEPDSCGLSEVSTSSYSDDEWTTVSYDSSAYLTTTVSADNLTDAVVKFYPDIHVSGNYTVMMYTPGCTEDDTCDSRGTVDVTIHPKDNGNNKTSTLYQTNSYEKYDVIYEGFVDSVSDSFQPYVVLKPTVGQSGNITIVAEKVEFVLISTTGGLNGLFEYDPSNYTSSSNSSTTEIYSTAINEAGEDLDDGAEIYTLAVTDSMLFIGGNFSSEKMNNFMAITEDGDIMTADGGLNDAISSIVAIDDIVVVGGNFTSTMYNSSETDGLSYVARYSIKKDSWIALGAGVDGPVTNIAQMSVQVSNTTYDALAIDGAFTEIKENDDDEAIEADGLALWLTNSTEWAGRTDLELPYIKGSVSASVATDNQTYIIAGELETESLSTSGGATVNEDYELGSMPFQFDSSSSSSVSKRATSSSDSDLNAIYAVTYFTRESKLYSVAGGSFSAVDSDDNSFKDYIVYNDDGVQYGLTSDELDSNQGIFALCNYNNESIVLGGSFSGSVGDSEIENIAIWDLESQALASTQPDGLSGDSPQINAIVARPGSSSIVVGGSFSEAGDVSCDGLCVYDMSNGTWSALTRGVGGNVTSLTFLDSDRLVVAGNMTTGSEVKSYMAMYDFSTLSWDVLGQMASELPGPVNVFVTASGSTSDAIVAGQFAGNDTNYLWAYDGSSWEDIGSSLKSGSIIYDAKLLPLKDSRSTSSIIPENMVLLVMGQLVLPSYGSVSAAFYDGSSWTPFVSSTKDDGSAGYIYTLFTQDSNALEDLQSIIADNESHMKAGFVVLISLAISLLIMFVIVLTAYTVSHLRRRSEGYEPFSVIYDTPDELMTQSLSPAVLFSELNSKERNQV